LSQTKYKEKRQHGIACQQQLLGPKLAGIWATGALQNFPSIFRSATVEANNFKFGTNLDLGSSMPKPTFRTKLGEVWTMKAIQKYWDPELFL